MPRFYRFGYQPRHYQWDGRPQQSHRGRSDDLAGLGDVTSSHFFHVPADKSPYATHKAHFERKRHFSVPRGEDPYYIHKHDWPTPPYQYLGAFKLSNSEKTAAVAVGVAAAAYMLLRKGGPLR